MKRFYEQNQPKKAEIVLTQHDLDRQKGVDEDLSPENRKKLLFGLAGRLLRDANDDINVAKNNDFLARLNLAQQEEVIQNMHQILDKKNVEEADEAGHSDASFRR